MAGFRELYNQKDEAETTPVVDTLVDNPDDTQAPPSNEDTAVPVDDSASTENKIDPVDEPAKDAETQEKPKAEEEPKDAVPQVTDASTEPRPRKDAITPPQSFAKELHEEFSSLTPKMQQFLAGREYQHTQLLQKVANERKEIVDLRSVADQTVEVVTPYIPMFQARGIQPMQGIANMLKVEATLLYGDPIQKVQLAKQLIKQYDIDINQVINEEPLSPESAKIMSLEAQVNQFQGYLQQQAHLTQQQELQRQMQQETNDWYSALESTAKDLPYFEQLEDTIMELVPTLPQGASKAQTLKRAYAVALLERPDIKALIDNQQKQTIVTQVASKQRAQVAHSKASSVSVNSDASKGVEDKSVAYKGLGFRELYDKTKQGL